MISPNTLLVSFAPKTALVRSMQDSIYYYSKPGNWTVAGLQMTAINLVSPSPRNGRPARVACHEDIVGSRLVENLVGHGEDFIFSPLPPSRYRRAGQ